MVPSGKSTTSSVQPVILLLIFVAGDFLWEVIVLLTEAPGPMWCSEASVSLCVPEGCQFKSRGRQSDVMVGPQSKTFNLNRSRPWLTLLSQSYVTSDKGTAYALNQYKKWQKTKITGRVDVALSYRKRQCTECSLSISHLCQKYRNLNDQQPLLFSAAVETIS